MNFAGENAVEARSVKVEWYGGLPLFALLLSLCGLVALPIVRAHYVQPLYDDMRSVTEPGRGLVTRIHVALALEGVQVQQYDESRDATMVQRYRSAVSEETAATAELARLVGKLGPAVRREFADMLGLQAAWHADVDHHLAGGAAASSFNPLEENHYEQLLLSAARLDEALNSAAQTRWSEIATATTALRWIGLLIAVVAFSAAIIVGWLGRKLRIFAVAAEQRKIELEAALASRDRLVRGITHDLKNPLHAIAGHAELLADGIRGPLNSQQSHSVDVIRNCVADELSLIDDLLEASLAEAGLLRVRPAETDLSKLIHEVVESYSARAAAAGHEISVEISPDVAPIVTDHKRVKQILSNLVSNAIKYSFNGKPIRIVAMSRERSNNPQAGSWLAIDVIDSGPGIPTTQMEVIFEEFSRLQSNAHKPGSGLGLSIARRVARLLGGDIEVKNVAGAGAAFTLWLPTKSTMASRLPERTADVHVSLA